MFARVNELEGTGDQLRDSVRDSQQISRSVDAIPGSLGMYYMIDTEAGKALAITLWETEEAMRSSEDSAREIRETSTRDQGTRVVSVGHYEVATNTVRNPASMLR